MKWGVMKSYILIANLNDFEKICEIMTFECGENMAKNNPEN